MSNMNDFDEAMLALILEHLGNDAMTPERWKAIQRKVGDLIVMQHIERINEEVIRANGDDD